MSLVLPQCQSVNPLENAFLFLDKKSGCECIVLTTLSKEWKDILKVPTELDKVRYIYFPTFNSTWKCQVYMNIACVTPCQPAGENVSKEAETIIRYLALTAKNTNSNYKIVNMVRYRVFLYIDTREPVKILGTVSESRVTKTALDVPITSREYEYTIVFDENWEISESKAQTTSGFSWDLKIPQVFRDDREKEDRRKEERSKEVKDDLERKKEKILESWSWPFKSSEEKKPEPWIKPTEKTDFSDPKNTSWSSSGKSDSFSWGSPSDPKNTSWYPPRKSEAFSWTPNVGDGWKPTKEKTSNIFESPVSTFGTHPFVFSGTKK